MSEIDYMNECMTRDLVTMLAEDMGLSLQEALDCVYNSDTYTKLKDPRTGLYFQSAVYVYDILQKEMRSGKIQ